MRGRYHYDTDRPDPYPDAVSVDGWRGIAFHVLGWQTEPDEDTEWTGMEVRTGRLVVVMVGDDQMHLADPDEITPLRSDEYCHSCGQIGCGCNVYA